MNVPISLIKEEISRVCNIILHEEFDDEEYDLKVKEEFDEQKWRLPLDLNGLEFVLGRIGVANAPEAAQQVYHYLEIDTEVAAKQITVGKETGFDYGDITDYGISVLDLSKEQEQQFYHIADEQMFETFEEKIKSETEVTSDSDYPERDHPSTWNQSLH